ncbi:sperm acrosome membrane-associated protein 6-like [Engystomops pustulosus]|uniref:sperm acrosome membrane-associated protein 6-like n=1 Tax=Engystomops pustulosus TaxID=76066 RepID=UPI003AFACA47
MRFFDSYYLLLQILVILCGAGLSSSCHSCFTTPAEKSSICQYAVSQGKMETEHCFQKLHMGFNPLTNISIAYSQVKYIKKYLKSFNEVVRKIDQSLISPSWVEQFERKMAEFVKHVIDHVASHPAEECTSSCGFQKAARTYSCRQCIMEDCKIPIACPLEVINVRELEQARIPCGASFRLPEHLKVEWKYAKNMKVTDFSYFTDISNGAKLYMMIKPVSFSHTGTYSCQITDDNHDVILRKFYYLNVIQSKSQTGEIWDVEFQRTLVGKLETPLEDEIDGPSTADKIREFLKSPIGYAVCAGVCGLLVTIIAVLLWCYAPSVDLGRNRPTSWVYP